MATLSDLFPEECPPPVRIPPACAVVQEACVRRVQEEITVASILAHLPFAYLSGPAGCGKTFLARQVVQVRDDAVLTASTGIAAVNLGDASTINALLRYYDTASLISSYAAGQLQARLRTLRRSGVKLIVLDETSMVSGDQLTVLVRAFDEVNHSQGYDAALEGTDEASHATTDMGLLLVGDFAQLPAIKAPFAFESPEWPRFQAHTIKLTTIRRQMDRAFVEALQAVRRGDATAAVDVFAPCFVQTIDHHFQGTTLVAKNEAVDRLNGLRHDTLNGELLRFPSVRSGEQQKDWQRLIPESLAVKVGARVMVLANRRNSQEEDDLTFAYVNGDLGTVEAKVGGGCRVKLDRTGTSMTIGTVLREWKEPTGKKDPAFLIRGAISYMPLRLCYASTCHKCVTGDTRVLVEQRGSICVEHLQVGDWIDTGCGPARVRVIQQTLQFIGVLTTDRGYRVTCSGDHRWKTPDSAEGFTSLAQLRHGTRLLLTREATTQGTNVIDKDTAWWIGVMIGDGNWTDRREGAMHFTCATLSQRDRWMTIAAKLGGRPNTRRDQRGCHLTSLPLRLRLELWGCAYATAAHKRIPEGIWQSGPTAWAACLQGLFDADGSAKTGRIVYCTRSRGLVDDIQLLLLYLGVPSTVGEYNGRTGLYWHIRISAEGRDRFVVRVGASHPQKRAALQAWKPNRQLKPYDGTDTVKTVTVGTVAVPMYDIELETIHELGWGPVVGSNSQGLSLDSVQVAIADHFFGSPAMLYVALSRCRTLEGLRIVGNAKMFLAKCSVDPKITEFL